MPKWLVGFICAAMAGIIGFACGALLTKPNREENKATIATIRAEALELQKKSQEEVEDSKVTKTELWAELKTLRQQVRNYKNELRRAWSEKQGIEQELNRIIQMNETQTATVGSGSKSTRSSGAKMRYREWQELGLADFAQRIPRQGNVPQFENIKVGLYGGIAYPKILQILGPDEMILEISNYNGGIKRLVRLKGYPTEGMVDNTTWRGYMKKELRVTHRDGQTWGDIITSEIAIIGTWSYTTTMGSQKTIFTAIPLDFIRYGLTEEEFKQLISNN